MINETAKKEEGKRNTPEKRASQGSLEMRVSQEFHERSSLQNIHERSKPGSQPVNSGENNQGFTPQAQINFYGHFAKKAVSNLKDIREQVEAANWILFLERQSISSVRAEHLKQLLFLCLHGRLAGVFAKPPQGSLEPLPEHQTIGWLTGQVSILRQNEQVNVQQEVSEGRTEYLAVQRIPFFGTQCFFAVSDEPIENWENAPK